MNYSKVPQNCSLKRKHYQMVQIAVAISIIKESPAHLTPGEFARNLQKVICQEINGESAKNDYTVDSETHSSQNAEVSSGTIICPESSQSNSPKNAPLDSRSQDEEAWHVQNSNLKSAKSIIKRSEGCSSETFVHELLDMTSSETQKLLETAADVSHLQENIAALAPDRKKSVRIKTKIFKVNTVNDVSSQDQIQSSYQNQNLGEPLPCKVSNLSKVNPAVKNIANISDHTKEILPSKSDHSVLPDSTSCSSPFNLKLSCGRLGQPNIAVRSTKNNCSQHTVPIHTEVMKVHKDNESERNQFCKIIQSLPEWQESYALLESHFYSQWHLENEKNDRYPQLQFEPLLNKSNFAESLRVRSPAFFDNWNKGHMPLLHEEYGRLSKKCAGDHFNTRNCQELLKAVIQETEDALRYAHLGIHPCWKESKIFIKKIPEWLHQENIEEETKNIYTEFMTKMVSILCQFNAPVPVEQFPVTVTIWWTILRMVRTQLLCLCATPALWHSGGNLLVSVLISVSRSACSQKISGYNTDDVDHMAEVAQTVAEVLRKVIGFACSLLKSNPQNSVSLVSGAELDHEMSSGESDLPTVKSNNDWKKSDEPANTSTLNCLEGELSFHKHPVKSADAKLNFEVMANSQVWKTKIESALISLATENTTDSLFETSMSFSEYPYNVNSSAFSLSHSTNIYISGSPENMLKYPALSYDPVIKRSLLRWGYLLQTECLPLIKNSLEMLYLQVQEIISLVIISAQNVKED